MKIGILNFHRALNYGAVLQCYGLQETLTALGHEVSVIETTKSVNFRYLDKKSSKAFLHLYLLGKVSNEYIVLLIKGIIPFSFKISNKK